MPKQRTISKTEAAQRQLDEAIRLWLDARDPLAVHTLTMAAFRVLYDLIGHINTDYHAHIKELLSVHGFSEFYAIANALKHADRDPHSDVQIPHDKENEFRIGIALVAYRVVSDDLTPEMGGFHLMSLSIYPNEFLVEADKDIDIEMSAQYAAQIFRADVNQRRMMTKGLIECIHKGLFPRNVSLRRRYH